MNVVWIHGVRRLRGPSMSKWVECLHREMAGLAPDIHVSIDEIAGLAIPFPKGIINRYLMYSIHAAGLSGSLFHIHDHANAHLVPLLRRKAPVLLTLHDLHPLEAGRTDLKSYPFRAFNVPGILRADHVITVSRHMLNEIASKLGYPEDRMSVVYCGVDHALYRPGYRDRTFLESYGLRGDSRYALFVGSEIPRKNFPSVLEAFKRISRNHDIFLLKVGVAGSRSDRARSLRAIERLHLRDRVVFCGHVPESELPRLYANAELLFAPSLYEGGSGIHVIEAMACGCPVVASDIPQSLELTGGSVLHCDPRDVDDIYHKAIALLEDHELREKVRRDGLGRAREFGWEKAAAAHVEIYRQFLA